MLSAGIDSALEAHQVEIQNNAGELLWKKKIENNKKGLAELRAGLEKIKKNTGDTNVVGIFAEAIGCYFVPFQHHLTRDGYRVVIVNPLEVRSARIMRNLDKNKDDPTDASVLASLPWMNVKYRENNSHQRHEISELTRLYQKMQEHETRLKNYLNSDLVQIFPEFLQFVKDIDTKTNFALLERYPTPSKILEVSEESLVGFVEKESRGKLGSDFVKKVRELAENTIGIPDTDGIHEYRIRFFIKRIKETKEALNEIETEIKRRTENTEEIKMIDAIPGIHRIKAASIYGEIGPIGQFVSARKLQGYGSALPKMIKSGKKEWAGSPTKKANHYLRYSVSVCARSVSMHSEEFRAIYIREKMKGKSDTQAYIVVGNRLLYHVFTILKNKKPYRKRMPQRQHTHPTISSQRSKNSCGNIKLPPRPPTVTFL